MSYHIAERAIQTSEDHEFRLLALIKSLPATMAAERDALRNYVQAIRQAQATMQACRDAFPKPEE